MPGKGRLAELVLHITNLVYFCTGIAVLTVGAIALADPATLINILSYIPQIEMLSEVMNLSGLALGPAIYLTVTGSLVIILSFVGCGGAFKRNKGLIGGFGITTLCMMLFNIALVMFYVIDPYYIEGTVKYNMNTTLTTQFIPVSIAPGGEITLPSDANANAWVTMQFEQGCCGVDGKDDYLYFGWNNTFDNPPVTAAKVPPSCCMQYIPNVVPTDDAAFVDLTTCMNLAYRATNSRGCSDYVMAFVTRYNWIFAVAAAGLTGLQAIILCLTMWLLVQRFDDRRISV